MLKKGQRVYGVTWGQPFYGTVAKDQANGLVWVQRDGFNRLDWFHAESLTAVSA